MNKLLFGQSYRYLAGKNSTKQPSFSLDFSEIWMETICQISHITVAPSAPNESSAKTKIIFLTVDGTKLLIATVEGRVKWIDAVAYVPNNHIYALDETR